MKAVPQIIFLDEANWRLFSNCENTESYLGHNNQWENDEQWYIFIPNNRVQQIAHCFKQYKIFRQQVFGYDTKEDFTKWLDESKLTSIVLHYPDSYMGGDNDFIGKGIKFFNQQDCDWGLFTNLRYAKNTGIWANVFNSVLYCKNKTAIDFIIKSNLEIGKIFELNQLKNLKFASFGVNNIVDFGKEKNGN